MAVVDEIAEQVLDVVDQIPPGRVLSYGDIAEWVGAPSPRLVGQVMHRYGGGVPWHRVVMADGRPAPHVAGEQLARLLADGTPLVRDGSRVDMRRARWDGG
ncbi:MAG: MGMT family protein [Frankiaceae bacterium]